MLRRSSTSRMLHLLALGLSLALIGALAAQYALDANQGVGSSGRNTQRAPQQAMTRPIYTVNRRTGDIVYDRSAAFNDPVYDLYQRYTIDPFRYSAPTNIGAAAVTARPGTSLQSPTYSPGNPRPTEQIYSRYSGTGSRRAASSPSAMRQSRYNAQPAGGSRTSSGRVSTRQGGTRQPSGRR
jgi:hypothetical protein